jgi:aminoglycoside phosphotransferase
VQQLRDERLQLETSFFAEDEPFVLVHGDFHGRNIIMRGSQVQGVLDWEFAGAYPLSELLGGGIGVDILEVDDDESDRENTLAGRLCVRLARRQDKEDGVRRS